MALFAQAVRDPGVALADPPPRAEVVTTRSVILRNFQSPGDLVMLTAAVRDLHLSNPGRFVTDVRTSCDALWLHNPYVTRLREGAEGVEVIECQYPLIHKSNEYPLHFIHAFTDFLNKTLNVNSRVHQFKGDVHLSREEVTEASPIVAHCGREVPYWLICAGGKKDFTIKWWSRERYQEVVDRFRGRIQFVQVGAKEHMHAPLDGVIDLRGKTDMRQLIRWVYHAEGVVCGVTLLMHLAAAVPTRPDRPRNRACVVIAGGREPVHWEQYPFHQYLHTVGQLKCCARGACWKSRTVPLNDGTEQDRPGALCVDVRENLPRCMAMITPERVAAAVAGYFDGGTLDYISGPATLPTPAEPSLPPARAADENAAVTDATALMRADAYLTRIPAYPDGFQGRGIVICGGGLRYFTAAWVCINLLRRFGCQLPIQLWHLGPEEMTDATRQLVGNLGVESVDGRELRKKHPVRTLNGWELKPFAVLWSPFREVLYLDADNCPVKDPTYLFDTEAYRRSGAVFWPDYGRLGQERAIWRLCGATYRDEPEFESGQILVDKRRCWRALCLTMHYNEHSDFYFRHIHGDKETFHMAFRRLNQPYAMPERGIVNLAGRVMCQHDFAGERIFQHRNLAKWQYAGENMRVKGFLYEQECLDYVAALARRWDARFPTQNRFEPNAPGSAAVFQQAKELSQTLYCYNRVGHDSRPMAFLPDGRVGQGAAGCEIFWNLCGQDGKQFLDISSDSAVTCRLERGADGIWRGRWLRHERMPIELSPMTS